MSSVHFTRYFAAAHRVWNDDSKCSNIHGHNYDVEVHLVSDRNTDQGFAAPFDAVKAVIDQFDHKLIVDGDDPLYPQLDALGVALVTTFGPPSTERLAKVLATQIAQAALDANPNARHVQANVKLRETPGIEASGSAEVALPVT